MYRHHFSGQDSLLRLVPYVLRLYCAAALIIHSPILSISHLAGPHQVKVSKENRLDSLRPCDRLKHGF